MHVDTTAVTIQSKKIVSNAVKDNEALLELSYGKRTKGTFWPTQNKPGCIIAIFKNNFLLKGKSCPPGIKVAFSKELFSFLIMGNIQALAALLMYLVELKYWWKKVKKLPHSPDSKSCPGHQEFFKFILHDYLI